MNIVEKVVDDYCEQNPGLTADVLRSIFNNDEPMELWIDNKRVNLSFYDFIYRYLDFDWQDRFDKASAKEGFMNALEEILVYYVDTHEYPRIEGYDDHTRELAAALQVKMGTRESCIDLIDFCVLLSKEFQVKNWNEALANFGLIEKGGNCLTPTELFWNGIASFHDGCYELNEAGVWACAEAILTAAGRKWDHYDSHLYLAECESSSI